MTPAYEYILGEFIKGLKSEVWFIFTFGALGYLISLGFQLILENLFIAQNYNMATRRMAQFVTGTLVLFGDNVNMFSYVGKSGKITFYALCVHFILSLIVFIGLTIFRGAQMLMSQLYGVEMPEGWFRTQLQNLAHFFNYVALVRVIRVLIIFAITMSGTVIE